MILKENHIIHKHTNVLQIYIDICFSWLAFRAKTLSFAFLSLRKLIQL